MKATGSVMVLEMIISNYAEIVVILKNREMFKRIDLFPRNESRTGNFTRR